VKKAIIIPAAVAAAGAVFVAALILVTNMRGGLDASHAGIKKLPLLGALVKVKQVGPEQAAAGHDARPGQKEGGAAQTPVQSAADMAFLRFGPQANLAQLTQELEAKKAEYDSLQQEAVRRGRELDAWQQQLKVERDALMQKFQKEKEDLAAQRLELDQKEKSLAALQLKIEDNESANLKATAGIYDKMEPEQAASILSQMYSGGQQDGVVKIISLMQDRTAAKALGSFPDAKTGAQITEQLQHVVKPSRAGG
jgi:flagellar motility protein MotE (MotC chaperone)